MINPAGHRLAGLLFLLFAFAAPAWSQSPPAPRLVVVLVVDQLRPDYLERHAAHFTGGFRTLMERGAVFDRAAYPYLNTVTCAGHTTIGTGALPYHHGMILNAWYDRSAGASTTCTSDPGARNISYGTQTGPGHSGRTILTPTLADRLRETGKGRVVSLSLKPRSAIGLAGHGADAIVWYDDRGGWATSSAFTAGPVPVIQKFVQEHPVAADYDRTWARTLPDGAYQHADDGLGERPPSGWTTSFAHPLGVEGGQPDGPFYTRWARSPYADEYLGRMAEAAIDGMRLGNGPGTDFLGVSFSVLDLVGHAFGPVSHEVQDVVVRLDLTIGRLLAHLDARVGRANYVLALSSDHGVAPIPEQVPGAGRHTSADIRDAIDGALTPLFGPPPAPVRKAGAAATATTRASYMAYSAYTDVYLAEGVLERLEKDGKAMAAVIEAITRLPGIARAFPGRELAAAGARESGDAMRRAAAFSYHPERSGDLIIVPRENWILSTAATTHGTLYPYDQRVPIIFYGPGVRAGRYDAAATPADIAPTLAALAGVWYEWPDGRALTAAVAPATADR